MNRFKNNKIIKKLSAYVLAGAMIFTGLPAFNLNALAAEAEEEEGFKISQDYTSVVYKNPDEKLANMGKGADGLPNGEPVLVKDGYELYFQYETGEIAIKDTKTNQVLTSNPYDVAASYEGTKTASLDTKQSLLSQIIIQYTDSDKQYYFNTYKHSALNGQIKMKTIRGGIRVEYTIGKEEKRKLVPRMITKESFLTNILDLVPAGRAHDKLTAYYTLKDAKDPTLTERQTRELQVKFQITKKYAVYVFDPNASNRELQEIEDYIKQYTKYTFEMMDEDHSLVEYTVTDKAPPLFKMALEYYIEEDGLKVRLPANGIRFDESTYKIKEINVLPYMGAVSRENKGYVFIPDGSGALVRSEDLKDKNFKLTNKIYGPDYSFYKVSGSSHMQRWRLPVYGSVENYTITREHTEEETYEEEIAEIPAVLDADGNEVTPAVPATTETKTREITVTTKEERSDGFVAIIQEGDSMASITFDGGANLHKYNTASPLFTPRPTDEMQLDVDSKGISSMILLASRRKYVGNYIIKYIMLSNNKASGAAKYEATWVGMATAYRDYLEQSKGMSKIQDSNDIPLFLQTLGYMYTAETFMGFPYAGKTPLTTFDNVKSIIDDLNGESINNIDVRITGWNNGGLSNTVPTKIKIPSQMGGANGLKSLTQYADSKGATVYPDIELQLIWGWGSFNGFSARRDLARAMDEQYAMEKKYFFLAQDFWYRMSHNITAPSRIESLYDKSMKYYDKYNTTAISVATMTRELHSDQYKKRLTNRAEAQDILTNLLARIQEEHGRVIGESANAYALPYIDATLNIDLDSSRFLNESESIPFYGFVTHGYVDTAGSAINMSGDYKYEILKAIESGSNPQFTVAYQNSSRLKENNQTNVYYSVDYETWLPEIIRIYKLLNENLSPVRNKLLIGHEFLAVNIVKVTYEGNISFILNYNNATVNVEDGGKTYTLEPLEFTKVN